MTFLPLAFVALVLLGCGGAPFQTGEATAPEPSAAPPAPEASFSPSDGGTASEGRDVWPGPSDSSVSTSLPGDAGPSSLSESPDASLDSSPDAESAYARCVAAFVEGCQFDPSACAFVSLESECGPPPGDV